ncbi:MAG: hypothetical protein JNG85_04535, partial [Spirochaetaceae bacterium]|nr:hypothetical protein [Spirochaetaceae bacterium]
ISVADSGPGVPEESVDRLFEPFYSTKAKGSGIGLALARSIARGAGGWLSYAARAEGGALFTLTLPVAGGGERTSRGSGAAPARRPSPPAPHSPSRD